MKRKFNKWNKKDSLIIFRSFHWFNFSQYPCFLINALNDENRYSWFIIKKKRKLKRVSLDKKIDIQRRREREKKMSFITIYTFFAILIFVRCFTSSATSCQCMSDVQCNSCCLDLYLNCIRKGNSFSFIRLFCVQPNRDCFCSCQRQRGCGRRSFVV